jgi:CcmD family protein
MSDIYVVLTIALIIWLGLFVYLFMIDRRVKKLEEENK